MYHAQRVPTFAALFLPPIYLLFITYIFIFILENSGNTKWGVESRSVLCPGGLVKRKCDVLFQSFEASNC